MKYTSKSLEKLVEIFSRLPGIGEKSAQRMVLFLMQEGKDLGDQLVHAITDLRENVGYCSTCYNLTEDDPCAFCQDVKRDRSLICVVEEPKDVLVIEKTGGYHGLYHVLGGCFSPLEGIGEDELHVQELMNRLDSDVKEVIIATNPTMEGEMTAAHLNQLLKAKGIRVTRIARGIPFGGSLEFNDAVTVAKAIEGRSELS